MSYKKYIFSLILFSICITTYAQPSFLDSTFGNNGIVITPPPGAVTYDGGSFIAVALQPDHKLVAKQLQ
jgi:hypothetical protein